MFKTRTPVNKIYIGCMLTLLKLLIAWYHVREIADQTYLEILIFTDSNSNFLIEAVWSLITTDRQSRYISLSLSN